MKRCGAFAIAVAAIAVGTAQPALAQDPDPCQGASCGTPHCWYPNVRVRPNHTRTVRVDCVGVTGARLITPAEHVAISDIRAETYRFYFDARPDDDAPRYETAVFQLDGYEQAVEVEVKIETIPVSENHAPECWPDRTARRSDGQSPVEISFLGSCWDSDGDEITIEGSGPGTHLELPRQVAAGESGYSGRYRTATVAGTETSHFWATDLLGARSPDTALEVTVGPDVDRLPACTPMSYSWADGYLPVYTRPGRVRRFGIVCRDEDGDTFEPVLSTPPSRGVLVPVVAPADPYAYWGERSIGATYTPTGNSMERDPFTFSSVGAHGTAPAGQFAIVPRALPENGGGGCGWSSLYVLPGEPGTVSLSCDDEDGDPLSVEVLTEPRHGVAAAPVVTPSSSGASDIRIPYVPNPGYKGYDCVKVRVTDGNGAYMDLVIDIWVVDELPGSVGLPPLPPLPPPSLPPLPLPPTGPPPLLRTQEAKAMAQRALGTRAVKRVRRDRGSEVWARAKLSRRELLHSGRSPGVAVICLVRCQIRSDAAIGGLGGSAAASRRKSAATKTPGQAHVITLDLGKRELRALRRARRPRAKFNLSVRANGAAASAVHRWIAIGR